MNMRKLLIVVAATPAFVTGTQNLMNDAMTWVFDTYTNSTHHSFVHGKHFAIRLQMIMNVL